MRRRALPSQEVEKVVEGLSGFLDPVQLKKLVKRGVERVESGKVSLIVLWPYVFVEKEAWLVPVLVKANAEIVDRLPSVWVDRGAVPRIASGADVMRPGITRMDEFKQGELVVVRDDTHSQPLAVGSALINSSEAAEASRGRVVKNIHHVDDAAWKLVNIV
ncbi:MAG: PUA domain-containing protein [Candidatus Caldarchaeum sp.]